MRKCTLSTKTLLILSIMFLTFYTAPLFSYCPIRFSDVGCFILLYLSIKNDDKIQLTTNSLVAILLILWCLIDSVILSFYPSFSLTNHFTQFFRFFFALLLYIYLPNLWCKIKIDTIVSALRSILIIHLIIQLSYSVIYNIGFVDFFNIVSSYEQRSNLISSNYLFLNHFIIVNTASGSPRFSGVFEEPAWFGWTLNLIIAIIIQYQYQTNKRILTTKDYILIFGGYLLTSSVSAIFSLSVILGIYYCLKNRSHKFKIMLLFWCVVAVGVFAVVTYSNLVSPRIVSIIAGNDGSSNFRLIGSWNSLVTLLYNDPLFGYGLGDDNKSLYYATLGSKGFHGISINGLDILDMHNMLFQIICNLGILGGVLFLWLLHGLTFKKSLIIIVAIVLTYFTVNVFNNYFFFTIISIATYYWNHNITLKSGLSHDTKDNTLLLVK